MNTLKIISNTISELGDNATIEFRRDAGTNSLRLIIRDGEKSATTAITQEAIGGLPDSAISYVIEDLRRILLDGSSEKQPSH
ncbi:MAG TPA: hypothetical protein VEF04_15660 [Blastocatellia bacterium]|nr:hypothetical protein [Blastocatellia bacterium]